MSKKARILVVDDEPRSWEYLDALLEEDGCDVETIMSGEDAIERVQGGERPDVIIIPYVAAPGLDGLDTLKQLMRVDRSLKVIVLSCTNDVKTAVDAIRLGARDFLTLPFDKSKLKLAMERCQERPAAGEGEGQQEHCDPIAKDWFFLAAASQMVRIRQQILQIAPVDLPVFIAGESGVGKEVVARMIHTRSTRRNEPFVKVNCAALPAELLESELFGHEQGAFTGALRASAGKFELANKGTIFLDEIAEMSPHLQAKLLHVLQDQQYFRLGGRRMMEADVRVLAATNVPVEEALRSGRLREDLYYRLNVFPIRIPPLRERASEIPMFFRHFHEKFGAKFNSASPAPSENLLEAATRYRWPGNLRELENFVKRYVILDNQDDSMRELVGLMAQQRPARREEPLAPQGLKARVRGLKDEAEMEAIAQALATTCWNRKNAAKMVGISYKAFLYKMQQFGFQTPSQPVDNPREASLTL